MLLLIIAGLAFAETTRSARVVSVYDGDTFTLETGEKVRLAGVNTPELSPMEPYAIEARDAAERFLGATEVTLHLGATEKDGYGRLIAGASVDGKQLSEHLVSLGLAHLFLIPPIEPGQSNESILAAQASARKANRGIWSDNSFRGDLHITSFHANAAGDDRENVNGEYLRVCNIASHPLNLEGYALTDASGNRWVLPAMNVPTGHTIRLHSGKGINQTDSKAQLTVYLGNVGPIWNNSYDKATIYDRYGRIMDMRIHETK